MAFTGILIPVAAAVWLLVASLPAEAASAAAPPSGATAAAPQKTARRGAVGRSVYEVPRDLAKGGSASDVLATLPFVEVDAEGEVSLRGDPNVTILLDGQTSLLFSPGARALALQRLPASTIEAIEIIRGASAQFPSNGADGVINIVTKEGATERAGARRPN